MLKSLRLVALMSVITLSPVGFAAAEAKTLDVVASFSIIGDFAKNVGGDNVKITTIVGPDGDAHVYEPSPADAKAMAKADVVLVNGLHFEGFLQRLVETSGTKATVVELTKGITPIEFKPEFADEDEGDATANAGEAHDHGNIDPHAFQAIANARIYVANIVDAFCAADAAGCETYKANAANYTDRLGALEKEVKDAVASIPPEKRTIITSHDAFGYFEHEYGLTFHAPEGISTEAEPSAADVAKLIDQVRQEKAAAVFVENITNQRLIEQIASETGLKIGGTLYSDALSPADGPASTYIDLMKHNIATIKGAILGS
ncbi:zinc ABC transporter substrate-binding protein AztC [Mesorhizobium sp. BAC0120]|uniref:zinc ABC transporter substrate-binding protein AztC n=1 Tax=Mesorhizobium sp. BAC0120 TaxID=3090670 RepID=UPI00298C0434|nr:zinc ABC transporter substrate-binding protein AztC [Mesorhizobium sp. BAC0120]MDW6024133.1 zinc ABC transporter substrate-binding protein AztC [Mesorhizobium sp. BAC0120]